MTKSEPRLGFVAYESDRAAGSVSLPTPPLTGHDDPTLERKSKGQHNTAVASSEYAADSLAFTPSPTRL